MYKLFFLSLILTANLSLSSSTNDSNCEEKKYSYELQLNRNDTDVVKFVQDGWNKLVAENRTKGANSRGELDIQCARIQVIGTERRYTILVKFYTDLFDTALYCLIFVWTKRTDPLTITCSKQESEVSINKIGSNSSLL